LKRTRSEDGVHVDKSIKRQINNKKGTERKIGKDAESGIKGNRKK
jgi:hypothetical protein